MSFNDSLKELSTDDIVNILSMVNIEVLKVYPNRIQCSCPSNNKSCVEHGKCSYYFNSSRVECLNTAHGGESLYNLLKKAGYKNPFSILKEKDNIQYNSVKPKYIEYKKKERSYINQKDLMKILEDTDERSSI